MTPEGVGVDEAIGQFLNLPDDALKVVSANGDGRRAWKPEVAQWVRRAGRPAVTFGIAGYGRPRRGSARAARPCALDLLAVKLIDETLPAVLAGIWRRTRRRSQVLLVQAAPETCGKALAEKYPGFDVVVRHLAAQTSPRATPGAALAGKTLLVSVGQKGKYVGVVGLSRRPRTSPKRYQGRDLAGFEAASTYQARR